MEKTEVLYNETCPICRYEIESYARQSAKDGLSIGFEPLSRAPGWGLTPDEAARALHVRQGGVVLSGLPAFRALWAAMPRWRWLAKVTGWPVVRPLTAVVYARVLAPALYQMHVRRQRRAKSAGR